MNKYYEQTKEYIQKNGIPTAFYYGGDRDIIKAVYKAVAYFGKLSCEEQAVYDKIQEVDFKGEPRIWYQGGYRSVEGLDDDEIRGAKMYMAHGYVAQKKEGG